MSLIPTFEIGLWNTWILILPSILIHIVIGIIMKKRNGLLEKESTRCDKKEKKLWNIITVTLFVSYIYPIFLPLKLGTAWFYSGLVIYLLGMILTTIATLNFATTPKDKPVTKGAYRISRHSMDFGMFLMNIGIGIACASWVFLLLAMVFIILMHIAVRAEESFCLERYANAYREYMNRTPKWLGIPKSRKSEKSGAKLL